jgi:O-succinylbenzoic acid--CoA ligase
MGRIILQEGTYTFDQLKSGSWNNPDPYFQSTFDFCREWLLGQSKFTLTTSGSTGKPKPIIIVRKQMESSASATGDFFKIKEFSCLFCCLNTSLIAGKMMLVRAMEWNCDLVLEKPTQNPLAESWINMDFDFAAMVPIQVDACLTHEVSIPKIKKIRNLIIGGAPINGVLKNRIRASKINAYQTYGMTETVSHVALASIQEEPTVGKYWYR